MAEEEKKKDPEEKAEAEEAVENDEAGETTSPPETSDTQAEPEASADAEPKPEDKPAEPDWKLQYARILADFDNYKKRAARDRDDTYRYVESQVLKDLLPSVDNLAMALDKAEDGENPFVKGVKLVYDGILAMLKDHGAEPFDSVGEDLDTEKMEAIATLPSPDVPEGKVSIESKKGWLLKGKVLRAAQVVVSSGKPE